MTRFKRYRRFHVPNRLALAAALVLCITALVGGGVEPRESSPFSRAVDAIAQQSEEDAGEANRKRGILTASFLLLRGR